MNLKSRGIYKQLATTSAFMAVFLSLSVGTGASLVQADEQVALPSPAASPAPLLDDLDPVAAQQLRASFADPVSRAAMLSQGQPVQEVDANGEVIVNTDRIDILSDVGTIRVNAQVNLAPSLDPANPGALEVESVQTFGAQTTASGQSLLARSGRIAAQRRGSVVVPNSIHGKLWLVTLETIGIQAAIIGAMALMPSDVTRWGSPDFVQPFRNFTRGAVIDQDHWYWNYIGHPWGGSEYYLLARNRDHTWWQSMLYSAAMSFFWESFTEGVFEQWSWQDLFITPIGGAVLGELRFRAVQALLNADGRPRSRAARALVVILDPIGAMSDYNRRRVSGD